MSESKRVEPLTERCINCGQEISWQGRSKEWNCCCFGYWYSMATGSGCQKSERGHAASLSKEAPSPNLREQLHNLSFWHECEHGGKYIVLLDDVDAALNSTGVESPNQPSATPTRESLEAEWMAQQKWLSFTNFLLHKLIDKEVMPSGSKLEQTISAAAGDASAQTRKRATEGR